MKPRALRISLLLLPALLLGGACSRSALPENGPTLSVQIRTEDTRSGTYAFDTDAVHSLSVFVFLPNGSLENSGRSSGCRLTLALSRGGGKRIFVLANAPAEVDACTSEAQLRALRTTLADQASGHFAMAWTGQLDVDGDTTLNLELPRIVAQVRLEGIRNRSSHALKLRALYLTNVPVAAAPWFSPDEYEPAAWAHPMGFTPSDWDGWLLDDLGGRVLAPGEELRETHLFHSLPNPVTTDAFAGTWSPRKTRLVLEAEMEGVVYYYPFTFDNLLANHRYTIGRLNITRPGSRDPDIPVDPRDLRVSVTLLSWSRTVASTDPI